MDLEAAVVCVCVCGCGCGCGSGGKEAFLALAAFKGTWQVAGYIKNKKPIRAIANGTLFGTCPRPPKRQLAKCSWMLPALDNQTPDDEPRSAGVFCESHYKHSDCTRGMAAWTCLAMIVIPQIL